jgi:flagellar protein FlaJ
VADPPASGTPRPKVRDDEVRHLAFEPTTVEEYSAARRIQEPADQPRWLEQLAQALVWGSGVLAVLALLGAALPSTRDWALGLALGGLLLGIASLGASLNLGTLRHLRAEVTGGNVYDQMRGARTLRLASSLMQFLMAAAWALVALRVLSRMGIGPELESPLVERALLVLVAALGVGAALAHMQSLRTPTSRDRSAPSWITMGLGGGAAVVIGVLAVLALAGQQPTVGSVDWESDDVAVLTLAAFASLALALRRSRGLPTTASLLADSPGGDRGTITINRTKAVLVPTILAFALLLVVFLLVLLFGIGIGELITTVGRNPLVLGALLFLVVALLGSLGLAVLLSRSAERDVPLYAKVTDRKVKQVRLVLTVSGVVAAAFVVLAALAFTGVLPEGEALHFVCFALLVALGPYGFYAAREANRIRRLEERFPDFLRDIASSHKGGLTLHQSVTIAARGEYGPLTPEVRKMADQLSWNVSFHEALERFGARVETPLVQRAVNLILQADKSGGSTTDVLLAAARDAREIKNLENERRQTMGLYTVVVYITFFVFLAVAATLYGQFAPAIVESSEAVQASAIRSEDIGTSSLTLRDYQLFYFVAAIVQAVGDGLVAGLLGSGKASLGLRHGFLMVLATYVTFILLL